MGTISHPAWARMAPTLAAGLITATPAPVMLEAYHARAAYSLPGPEEVAVPPVAPRVQRC